MKALLILSMTGYTCWLVSELLELLLMDYNTVVAYLTAAFHLLVGVGFTGLFRSVTTARGWLLWVMTGLVSISHLALAALILHVFWSGDGVRVVLGTYPVYLLFLLGWAVGILVFSLLVIRSGRVPVLAGWAMLFGFVLLILSRSMAWPALWIHFITVALSALLIYLCRLGLRRIFAQEFTTRPDPR